MTKAHFSELSKVLLGNTQLTFCHQPTTGDLKADVQVACDSRHKRWGQSTQSICLIDMDGTLFPFSVAPKFGLWLLRRKYLSIKSFLLALFNWWGYQLKLLTFESLMKRIFQNCLSDKSHEWIEKRVCEFGMSIVKKRDGRVHELLQRELPRSLTILTSRSPHFLVSYFARHFQFDAWQASYCAHEFSSKPDRLVSGQQKKEICQALHSAMGAKAISITAVGDTGDDIPLLSVADRAIAVAPDRALRRKAKQLGWEIWQD